MKTIAIVDYGMGNLDSVKRAVEECGGHPILTNNALDLESASNIILPGVGAFTQGMQHILALGLDEMIKEQALIKGIPLLGICLGMQLLASVGYEGGQTQGLGLIAGEVHRFKTNLQERIPHMGWNEINVLKPSPLLKGISTGSNFYFVHSYHFICQDENNLLATTDYCGTFASVVGNNNIFGVQFHPEKSQKAGFKLLKNFFSL